MIGSPRSVDQAASAPTPQAVAPLSQTEAAQAQHGLQLGCVLAAGLVPPGVVGERGGRDAELGGHEIQECRGRLLAGTKALARVAQQAELHGEADAVHAAALGTHQQEVLGAEHVVPGHLSRRGRDGEQAGALFGGQQGSAGTWDLGRMRPIHNLLAFQWHSVTGQERQVLQ